MMFKDQIISADTDDGPLVIRITGDALSVFWGADVGPQDEAGLVEGNRSIIEAIAVRKLAEGGAGPDGVVEVDDLDVED